MAKLVELKERIKALHDIRTVARTLATVSAAKLAANRRRAAGLREYARELEEVVMAQQGAIAARGGVVDRVLCEPARVERVALLVITGDRGMCGGYNLALCHAALELWQARQRAGQEVRLLFKGGKGERWFHKHGGEASLVVGWQRGGVGAAEVDELLARLVGELRAGDVDEVHVAYTRFHSPLRCEPVVARFLPVVRRPPPPPRAWSYEPSFAEVFEPLLAEHLRVRLSDVLLESYASEHGTRMVTMEEASERAEKSLAACRVRYHRLRRESITLDLLGVLSAARRPR